VDSWWLETEWEERFVAVKKGDLARFGSRSSG
jgi:hypothetical protein